MHVWPVLEPGSPQAAALWHMFALTLVVCAVIFALVAGLVAYVSCGSASAGAPAHRGRRSGTSGSR